MTEASVVFNFDVGWAILFAAGLWLLWVAGCFDGEDDEAEEDAEEEATKVIIPALPGFFAMEITPDELEAASSAMDVRDALLEWPIIAWEMSENAAYEPPLAITTAGTEQDHAAIRWPDGRVHDQGGGVYNSVTELADYLFAEREKRKLS